MAGRPRHRADFAYLSGLPREDVELLFSRIETGESLTSIAADLTVSRSSLCAWLEEPERAHQYNRARIRAATALVEQCLEIADSVEGDAAAVMRARLRINCLMWIASKWDRRTFGAERQQVPAAVSYAQLHLQRLRRQAEIDAGANGDARPSGAVALLPASETTKPSD
jgi:hypothetical protein